MTDLQSGLVWGWLGILTIWLAVETRRRIAVTDRLTTDVGDLEAAEAQVEAFIAAQKQHEADQDATIAQLRSQGADPALLDRLEAANARLKAAATEAPAPGP